MVETEERISISKICVNNETNINHKCNYFMKGQLVKILFCFAETEIRDDERPYIPHFLIYFLPSSSRRYHCSFLLLGFVSSLILQHTIRGFWCSRIFRILIFPIYLIFCSTHGTSDLWVHWALRYVWPVFFRQIEVKLSGKKLEKFVSCYNQHKVANLWIYLNEKKNPEVRLLFLEKAGYWVIRTKSAILQFYSFQINGQETGAMTHLGTVISPFLFFPDL